MTVTKLLIFHTLLSQAGWVIKRANTSVKKGSKNTDKPLSNRYLHFTAISSTRAHNHL